MISTIRIGDITNSLIPNRKQQKLVYRIFTCKFSISSLQCQ